MPRNIALHVISSINLILLRNICLRDKNQRPKYIKTWCWVCNDCFTVNDRRDLFFCIFPLREFIAFALWQIKIFLITSQQGIWCVILKTNARQTKPSLLQEYEWSKSVSETPPVLPGTIPFIGGSLFSYECKKPATFNAFISSPFFTLHFLFLLWSIVRQLDLCTLWFISSPAKTLTGLPSAEADSLFAQTHIYTHTHTGYLDWILIHKLVLIRLFISLRDYAPLL